MRDDGLSARIRELRTERGWTQAELAHEAGVTVGQVHRWEAGRSKPSGKNAVSLATALRTTPGHLYGEEPLVRVESPATYPSFEEWRATERGQLASPGVLAIMRSEVKFQSGAPTVDDWDEVYMALTAGVSAAVAAAQAEFTGSARATARARGGKPYEPRT
jgi:transcriptional regulator with XRE-family HTH domain